MGTASLAIPTVPLSPSFPRFSPSREPPRPAPRSGAHLLAWRLIQFSPPGDSRTPPLQTCPGKTQKPSPDPRVLPHKLTGQRFPYDSWMEINGDVYVCVRVVGWSLSVPSVSLLPGSGRVARLWHDSELVASRAPASPCHLPDARGSGWAWEEVEAWRSARERGHASFQLSIEDTQWVGWEQRTLGLQEGREPGRVRAGRRGLSPVTSLSQATLP